VERKLKTMVSDGASLRCALTPMNRIPKTGPADEGSPESELSYRELFEISHDGIAHLDLKGQFVDCNPAFLDFMGYPTVESMRGLTLDQVTAPEHLLLNREATEQTTTRGFSDLVEREYIRKDGTRVSARIRSWLRRNTLGTPVGMWVVALDLLREHGGQEAAASREQLFHSQKMEAIGRLAGGIAHDFNSLLTTIMGYTSLIRSAGTLDGVVEDGIREIDKAALRAAALVGQLLAFSRRQELSPKVIDINDLVMNLKRMLERLLGEDVALLADLDPEAGRIEADPGRIEQIIINLAVNARDAMPQGGRLLIHTRRVELNEDVPREHPEVQPGMYVLLSVSDTGIGMDEKVKARIFEPFFTTKEKGKGTGLGLSTVYGIVRQSGGHVYVNSEAGKGTTFRIYFPFHQGPSETPGVEPASAPLKGGSETILLVEDEPEALAITAMMLTSLGYAVIEKQNPLDAVAFMEGGKGGSVDLVLTDVVMPAMSGRVLADRVKRIRPGVKVLFVAGSTDDVLLGHGVTTSEVLFLQKPYSLAGLDGKVREALRGKALT
jgi:PAS domain S-box-containing protein